MAHIMVQLSTKDFSEWKKGFDSEQAELTRMKYGTRSKHVFQDASDPNQATVLLEMESLDKAKAFATDPELRMNMQKAGVMGAPNFTFLKEL